MTTVTIEGSSGPASAEILSAARALVLPSAHRSLGQLAVTVPLFLALWAGMYFSLSVSYALTLALALPAAGLVVRIFIFQHDAGHGSFLPSRRANEAVGWLCCLFTLTPYANWRRQHAQHHANWNNLDRRQSGLDIYSTCLTVAEYRDLSPRQRWVYRLTQNPAVMLLTLPPLVFFVLYRLPFDTPRAWKKERRSVHLTNLALAGFYGAVGLAVGFPELLMVQLPISILTSIIGVWLFSVQHKFEDSLWLGGEDWNAVDAAVRGSSYLKLPRILQWFTGNIGFHHVHHFDPRIPNYRLQEQHERMPVFRRTPVLSLSTALRARHYCLWDEAQGRMVPIPKCRVADRPAGLTQPPAG
ncbi:MAG: fatty acid desaturase [Azospirillum sp.]|nr:fatty acid desaturase [Azospirillum sp.]